ncbi:hypothetical protein DTW90_30020 [Neorhizobium sp. P12A]|uniref:hypothetical protein n=1 Tax=Neorhizobium sp. P12A TaxID=2268027 RepID=UPI0011ED892E|nr:hypothetical protein [Neorhizobium sp. P12A]KAA0690212.1 hypothetical protein DTW90_30020 [Neorhizobium sp. P12A]
MARFIEAAGPKPVSVLTVHQRDQVLLEIRKSVQFSALASKAAKDRRSKPLEAFREKVAREHEAPAAGYFDASAELVYRALDLLAE